MSQIPPRRFPARNDGLQEAAIFIFHEWHGMSVVPDRNDHQPLARITRRVRVAKNVQQALVLDRKHHFLKGYVPLGLQAQILCLIPAKWPVRRY